MKNYWLNKFLIFNEFNAISNKNNLEKLVLASLFILSTKPPYDQMTFEETYNELVKFARKL